MFSVSVIRPEGHELTIHTTTRERLGDVVAREAKRGSEVVGVSFPGE